MKTFVFWLLPPVGFICGYLFGASDSAGLPAPRFDFPPVASQMGEHNNENLSPAVGSGQPGTKPDELPSSHATVPFVTLQEALSYPSELHRVAALARILDTLRPEQFASFHAAFLAIERSPTSSLLQLLFRRWAQVDPERAMEAADGNWKNGVENCYPAILQTWGENDPASLLAYAQKLSPERKEELGNIETFAIPKPGVLPPQDAIRRIREIQGEAAPSLNVVNAMGAIFRDWAMSDPQSAWASALSLPGGGPEQQVREWALQRVIESQTASDPAAAARLIDEFPDGPERVQLQSGYIYSLVEGNKRQIAKSYAFHMPEGEARGRVLAALADALFVADKEEAIALVTNLSASELHDPTVFTSFFEEWMRTEPQRAGEFLFTRIPADAGVTEKQQTAYEQIFRRWAGSDPRAASEFLLKLPENIRRNSLERAVSIFCDMDSKGAATWASALPSGSDRDKAMYEVGAALATKGVNEVTDWLNQLPSDSGKRAAIEGFARGIVSVSPDDALAWIRSIPDQTDRLERLKRVWSNWKDRDAALQWRDTSTLLSPAERTVLQ